MSNVHRYRKKPVEVEAIQWTGDNAAEVKAFVTCRSPADEDGFLTPGEIAGVSETALVWNTQERGWFPCPVGHHVIRGRFGEFYPCSPQAISETYDPA